jgi:diketogulonate reductase-like aldo/keto reductase
VVGRILPGSDDDLTGVDTAQAYRNETETGTAVNHGQRARDEVFVTTKYVGLHGKSIEQSIADSLEYVS